MAEEKGIATKHEVLVDKAKYAIDQVFSDRSVTLEDTAVSLEELREYLEEYLDTAIQGLYDGMGAQG